MVSGDFSVLETHRKMTGSAEDFEADDLVPYTFPSRPRRITEHRLSSHFCIMSPNRLK
jgi:hypothetical protein